MKGKNVMNRKKIILLVFLEVLVVFAYLLLMRSGNYSWEEALASVLFHKKIAILNIVVLSLSLLILILLSGYYWVGTSIFFVLITIICIATYEKMQYRNEGILPSDLSMITSLTDILSMVSGWVLLAGFFLIALIGFISFRLLNKVKIKVSILTRFVVAVMAVFLCYMATNVQQNGTVSYKVAYAAGNDPMYWDPSRAVMVNGPIMNFVNNLNANVMDKPVGYSKSSVDKVIKKYQKVSKSINRTRKRHNQKVVFILSQSFSDPTQVPGVKLSHDPMPYTRSLIENGFGGNMISDGYGGGTANMEYQALTGLSLGNFSSTLPTPYTQLVVKQNKMYSVNNMSTKSMAIHPYSGALYSRKAVFKKMKFKEFDYLKHGYSTEYSQKIGNSPYVSDKSAYSFLLNKLKKDKNSDFVQLSTMQNHMPFLKKYYKNNQFKLIDSKISSSEREQIEAYSKGVKYTDEANKYLLKKLSKMKQKVTVVFYGDHLPGIYQHVNLVKNGVRMHMTPYFIWTNHGKLKGVGYKNMVGTYGFSSEMLQATNSKVTPYFALIQRVNSQLPIIGSKISTAGTDPNLSNGGMKLVARKSKKIVKASSLTKKQRALLRDYQIIQYDLTVGKKYSLGKMTN